MAATPELFIPKGLVPVDSTTIMSKLGRFAGARAENMHLVSDFDRTLTVASGDTQEDITTWHILKKHLPAEGQTKYAELYNLYRPMEMEGKMQVADAEAWWSQILDLFVRYKIDMSEVEEDFLSKVTMRPGTAELFSLALAYNIPTVILSAGVKDIIELWARTYRINPSVIMATDLILDSDQRITGWDAATLVHVLNKKERGHSELSRLRTSRPFGILVGDALSDADMADGHETVLRVLVQNPRPDENTNANLPGSFDLICTSGNFGALTLLIEQLLAGRPRR